MLGCYLHTLPGTPFVYQGEELGMTNIKLPSIEDYDDIDTKNYYHTMIEDGASEKEALEESQSISRDNARTPMQWDNSENGGFSQCNPWLAVNENYTKINAKQQMEDEDSVFKFYQKLIALRKENPVMIYGDFKLCCEEKGPVIAYTRSLGDVKWLAVHNFSEESQRFEYKDITGTTKIILGNYKEQQQKEKVIELRAYETMILRL